ERSRYLYVPAPRCPLTSMLEPGVVTCPPTGEVCACTPEAASNATINTENDKQRQRRVSQLPENPLIFILRSARAARGQPLLLTFTQKPVPLWKVLKNIGVRQFPKDRSLFSIKLKQFLVCVLNSLFIRLRNCVPDLEELYRHAG